MRRLPATATEDLLEVFTRRYGLGATVVSSNRPIEDWGQLLGDTAAGSSSKACRHRGYAAPYPPRDRNMNEASARTKA